MKNSIKTILVAALLGAFLAAGQNANAQPKPAKDAAADTTKAKRDWYPFSGTVVSADTAAKTVSLAKKEGSRVLQTDGKTTLEQNGKPATLADIKPGNYLHGKLHKNAAGAEVVTDAKIELAPPVKNGATSQVGTATATTDTTTNAPAKKKRKTTTQ
jgi:hypothetical protein